MARRQAEQVAADRCAAGLHRGSGEGHLAFGKVMIKRAPGRAAQGQHVRYGHGAKAALAEQVLRRPKQGTAMLCFSAQFYKPTGLLFKTIALLGIKKAAFRPLYGDPHEALASNGALGRQIAKEVLHTGEPAFLLWRMLAALQRAPELFKKRFLLTGEFHRRLHDDPT